jgi:hypothetical protein
VRQGGAGGPETTALRLRLPLARYVTRGAVSGKVYQFGPGEAIAVDAVDAPEMLARRRRFGCCGGPIVEEPLLELIGIPQSQGR